MRCAHSSVRSSAAPCPVCLSLPLCCPHLVCFELRLFVGGWLSCVASCSFVAAAGSGLKRVVGSAAKFTRHKYDLRGDQGTRNT